MHYRLPLLIISLCNHCLLVVTTRVKRLSLLLTSCCGHVIVWAWSNTVNVVLLFSGNFLCYPMQTKHCLERVINQFTPSSVLSRVRQAQRDIKILITCMFVCERSVFSTYAEHDILCTSARYLYTTLRDAMSLVCRTIIDSIWHQFSTL